MGSTCWLCGFAIDMSLDYQTHRMASTVDEVDPMSNGGSTTDIANLRHAHRMCNSIRGNKPVTPALRHAIRIAAADKLGIVVTSPGTTSRAWR